MNCPGMSATSNMGLRVLISLALEQMEESLRGCRGGGGERGAAGYSCAVLALSLFLNYGRSNLDSQEQPQHNDNGAPSPSKMFWFG